MVDQPISNPVAQQKYKMPDLSKIQTSKQYIEGVIQVLRSELQNISSCGSLRIS